MANNYKVKTFSNSATGTSQALFTASAATTLVKSVIVNCDKTTPNVNAILRIKKSGGAEKLIKKQNITLQTVSYEMLYDVLPLESGDALYAQSDDTDIVFVMSWVESTTSVIGQSIDVLSDVDTTGKANGDVLTYNSSTGNWEAEPSTGGNTFSTISVATQSPVVADSTTDTLTLAAANTNVVITTNATTDTITFGLGADLTVGSVSTTGNLFALGSITGNNLTIGNVSSSGDITANSATLSNIYFTGGGTTTIGPNNTLPTDPADLEIRTNGNCDVVLDYDDNESSQAFRVKDGDGNVMFSVDEDGISVANGTASTGAVLRLGEATANGTNYVAVQAPASLAANTTYTLPTADGTNGQVLSTNGSGTLSWATASAAASYSTVRTQSGTTYTLVLGDAGDYIQTTSTTAVTITVPLQSSVAWAADTEIYFEQNNTGQITIAGASGVTINSSETLKTAGRYSVIALKRVASDTWTLTGERQLA